MLRRSLFLLLVLLLAACGSPTEDAAPRPSLDLGLSYAAASQRPALLDCLPAEIAPYVDVQAVLGDAVEIEDYDLLIRLGEPQELPDFVVALGEDELVAVVNSQNPLRQMEASRLADLFNGRAEDWAAVGGDEGQVQVWIPLEGDEVYSLVRRQLLQGGDFSGAAYLAPNPELMAAAIAADPAAIGLLPASQVPEDLRAIPSGIQAPVLALAAAEPDEALQAALACMQER